jgi:hypothetical protein
LLGGQASRNVGSSRLDLSHFDLHVNHR